MAKRIRPTKQNRPALFSASLGMFILIASGVWMKVSLDSRGMNRSPTVESTPSVSSLSTLTALPLEDLSHMDIARMNLLCAQGLPGAADLDVNGSLAILAQMAARVRSETERNLHRYQSNPAEFENSEGFFRMIMLAVVLTEDFKVRYAPDKRGCK